MAEGLAQQMAQPAPQGSTGMPSVEEIISMLMQGASPEQLIAAGIPQELVMQAIQVLEQQMAAQQAPVTDTGAGLAQSMAAGR